MKILMLDRSIGFDPDDITARPLGARQRSFIALAEAFVGRGHDVVARRSGGTYVTYHGVRWGLLDDSAPAFGAQLPDRILAWRDPLLLDDRPVAGDGQRWLWFDGDVARLDQNDARMALLSSLARLIFTDPRQRDRYHNDLGFIPRMIAPGACPAFVAAGNDHLSVNAREPVAISVAGWNDGIDHLIRIWCDEIAVKPVNARFEIYSAALSHALAGQESSVPDVLVNLVRDALSDGVRVCMPLAESEMAAMVRQKPPMIMLEPGCAMRWRRERRLYPLAGWPRRGSIMAVMVISFPMTRLTGIWLRKCWGMMPFSPGSRKRRETGIGNGLMLPPIWRNSKRAPAFYHL
jgi:hypothetical protein